MGNEFKEVDFFGEVRSNPEKAKGREKFKTMQELWGYTPGQKCKTCRYLIKKEWGRNFYKCQLWKVSNSSAIDIRIHDTACKRFDHDPDYNKKKEGI